MATILTNDELRRRQDFFHFVISHSVAIVLISVGFPPSVDKYTMQAYARTSGYAPEVPIRFIPETSDEISEAAEMYVCVIFQQTPRNESLEKFPELAQWTKELMEGMA
jgi:hypothetical protein